MDDIQKRLDALATDVKTLSLAPPADGSEEATAKRQKEWQNLLEDVSILRQRVAAVNAVYMLSPDEQRALAEWITYKTDEVSGRISTEDAPGDASPAPAGEHTSSETDSPSKDRERPSEPSGQGR